MNHHNFISRMYVVLAVGLVIHAFIPGCHASVENVQISPEQQKRLKTMQAEGSHASLTIFPVVMEDNAIKDVADVLALLLEQSGMKNLETSDTVFRLPKEATFDQASNLFGEFVRNHPIETDYALYAEFVGTPANWPTEIRGVIVDKAGQSVLVIRKTSADQDFKRAKPKEPMGACDYLAQSVRTQLGIPKSAQDDSGKGKFARMFAENSPVPDKAEWDAMERRQAVMNKAGRNATLAVYPVRFTDEKVGVNDAAHMATLLNKKKLCEAKAVDSPLRVTLQPTHSEQKLLWELARKFQDHVKQNPPAADYAILADYTMRPRVGRAWTVHFVICDRAGDWVIVDFQNNHHDDFQSIDPRTPDDCADLVAKRIKGYLQ